MEGDGSNVSDSIGADVKRAMETARKYIKETYNIEVKPVGNFFLYVFVKKKVLVYRCGHNLTRWYVMMWLKIVHKLSLVKVIIMFKFCKIEFHDFILL